MAVLLITKISEVQTGIVFERVYWKNHRNKILVVTTFTFVRFLPPLKALKEMRRVLKPSGGLIAI